jgi:hypothetical protein
MKRSLARALAEQKSLAEAEDVLIGMLGDIRTAGEHPERTTALEDMIPLLETVGREDAADEVRQLLGGRDDVNS